MTEGRCNLRHEVRDCDGNRHVVTLSADNNGLTLTTPDGQLIYSAQWDLVALHLMNMGIRTTVTTGTTDEGK